jgi:hypothetical protein
MPFAGDREPNSNWTVLRDTSAEERRETSILRRRAANFFEDPIGDRCAGIVSCAGKLRSSKMPPCPLTTLTSRLRRRRILMHQKKSRAPVTASPPPIIAPTMILTEGVDLEDDELSGKEVAEASELCDVLLCNVAEILERAPIDETLGDESSYLPQ